jgi:hypothetical protein
MDTTMDTLNSQEALERFKLKLEKMDINNPNLLEFLKDSSQDEVIKKQLLTQTNCKIQLYMLEAFDLASRDIGSFSDPYLIIRSEREPLVRETTMFWMKPTPSSTNCTNSLVSSQELQCFTLRLGTMMISSVMI